MADLPGEEAVAVIPSPAAPRRGKARRGIPGHLHGSSRRGTFLIVRIAYNFYVYMLTNKSNEVLYAGVTNDLAKRLWQHRNLPGNGFANRYNCNRLVYYEWYQDIRQAIARETQIKGWSRAKKDALVVSMNPEWRDLSEEWDE